MSDDDDIAAVMARWRAQQKADDEFLAKTAPDGGGATSSWDEACRKADAAQKRKPASIDDAFRRRLLRDDVSLAQAIRQYEMRRKRRARRQAPGNPGGAG